MERHVRVDELDRTLPARAEVPIRVDEPAQVRQILADPRRESLDS